MDEELLEIIKKIDTEKINIGNFEFYKADIFDKEVVMGICGIGKVNSAIYTQLMIDNFYPDTIINIGVAGSTDDNVGIGSLVIGTEYFYHDFDCREFGYKLGQIPKMSDIRFIADENLVNLAFEKSVNFLGEKRVFKGNIASGDIFVADKNLKYKIKRDFNSLCCEMESCAIIHTCHVNGVKYLALRSISDNANENADTDFKTFVEESAKVVKGIVLDIIKDI